MQPLTAQAAALITASTAFLLFVASMLTAAGFVFINDTQAMETANRAVAAMSNTLRDQIVIVFLEGIGSGSGGQPPGDPNWWQRALERFEKGLIKRQKKINGI